MRRLISARHEAGDTAGALAEFAEFAKRLRAEIGVDPMPETLAARDAVAKRVAARSDRGTKLPFVGRNEESATLDAVWQKITEHHTSLAIVSGEAGIGKTRLIADFAERVAEGGGRVLIGGCAFPESTSFQPFVEALRSALPLVAGLALETTAAATLASLIPELKAPEGAPAPLPPLEGERERERTFDAVASALTALARPRPVLLVLEDLHFAGEATLSLLEFVLRRTTGSRMLVLATTREGEPPVTRSLERARREASARDAQTSIALTSLSPRDSATLVASGIADPRIARSICARAEGHPLYLSQLIESALEGSIDAAEGTLRDVLEARTSRLSLESREAGEIAAAIGRRFPSAMLGPVAGWSDAEARAALSELMSHRLVREVPGRGLFDFGFAHQLVAEAFLAREGDAERTRERHRRIAQTFVTLYPSEVEELAPSIARHFDEAGDLAGAASHYLTAGRRAMRLGAVEEAAGLLRRCADIATDEPLRADALLAYVRACSGLGDLEKCESGLAELHPLAEAIDDPELTFDVSELRAMCSLRAGDVEGAERGRAAMELAAGRLGSLRHIGKAASHRLDAYAAGRFRDEHLLEALETAERFSALGHFDVEANARAKAAWFATLTQRRSEALESLEAAERAALRSGLDPVRMHVARMTSFIGIRGGDTDLAERGVERWLELAKVTGHPLQSARAAEARSWVLAERSQLGAAIASLRGSLTFFEAHRHMEYAVVAGGNLADLLLRAGAFGEAMEALAVADAHAFTAPYWTTNSATTWTFAYGLAGRLEEARAAGARALDLISSLGDQLREIQLNGHLALAELIADGDVERAARNLERALDLCAATGKLQEPVPSLALLADVRMRQGDVSAARVAIDDMLGREPYDAGVTEWPQRCDFSAAVVSRATGHPERAGALLGRAHARTLAEADTLEEPYRSSFLALPWHVAIIAAAERSDWPENATQGRFPSFIP